MGRSSKVTLPAALAATFSNPARRDSPPLVRMISGNSDQGGCALRRSKRSEPCADSSASSVSSSAPASSVIRPEYSSNLRQICVSKPSASSKAAIVAASWPTGAMINTHSPSRLRDTRARLSRVAALSTDRRMRIEIAPRSHRCLQRPYIICF